MQAGKNSCFGPFSVIDYWYDEFLGCELLRVRNCFRQDLGSEQMVLSNWVLGGKFKYIFTNVLVSVQKPQGIITSMGAFSTPVLKWEKGKCSYWEPVRRGLQLSVEGGIVLTHPQEMEPGD